MKKLLKIYGIFVLVSLVVYVILRATGVVELPENWPTYSPKGSGYSVLVPGTMTEMKEEISSGIVFLNGEMIWLGVVYRAGYADFPGTFLERFTPEGFLNDMVMMMADDRRRLVNKEESLLQDSPLVHAEYEDQDGGRILVRYCLRDRRLYRLLVSVSEPEVEPRRGSYEKFLNSFKLVSY